MDKKSPITAVATVTAHGVAPPGGAVQRLSEVDRRIPRLGSAWIRVGSRLSVTELRMEAAQPLRGSSEDRQWQVLSFLPIGVSGGRAGSLCQCLL